MGVDEPVGHLSGFTWLRRMYRRLRKFQPPDRPNQREVTSGVALQDPKIREYDLGTKYLRSCGALSAEPVSCCFVFGVSFRLLVRVSAAASAAVSRKTFVEPRVARVQACATQF